MKGHTTNDIFQELDRTYKTVLDFSAEKRTQRLGRNPCKPRAENRVMRQPREPDLIDDAGHLAEQIHRNAVGFAQFDPGCIQREHRRFGEPATPFGVGGFVWVSDNRFNLRNRNRSEEPDFGCQTDLSLRFLQQ